MKALFLSLLLVSSLHLTANAGVVLISTDEYAQIRTEVLALANEGPAEEILLAFDIDKTLLLVEECLSEEEAKGFTGWLATAHRCPARLTEDSVDEILREFQSIGFATLALTARADNLLAPTERELKNNGLEFLGFPFLERDNFKEPFTERSSVVFKDGVTYASNKNKGEVLKILLRRLPKSYKEVVFVDDNSKNIRAMKKAFEQDPDVHVRIYHYTRYDH